MRPRIEVVSRELTLVHDCVVDYDLTPAQAIEGLPDNNPLIATDYPQGLWNGGKSGKVEGVTIPLCAPRRRFTTEEGRDLQREIGFGNPAELAALKGEDVRQALRNEDIWWIASLREKDEDLWLFSDGSLRPVCLRLISRCHGFYLLFADHVWFDDNALVGAPQ